MSRLAVRSRRLLAATALVLAVSVATAALAGTSVAHAGACWEPPVGAPVIVGFDPPACTWCAGHRGLEYGPTTGRVVRSVAAGRVAFAGVVVDRRYVSVDLPDGTRVTYGWLTSIAVIEGQPVTTGTIVGRAGDRLMFTVRRGGDYVDPAPLLGRAVRRPWLVPRDGPGREPPAARLVCPAEQLAAPANLSDRPGHRPTSSHLVVPITLRSLRR